MAVWGNVGIGMWGRGCEECGVGECGGRRMWGMWGRGAM